MHRLPDGKLVVSATDLVGFLACGHLTNLDRALVAGKVAKPDRGDDPGLDLLRRRGWEHEERYIAELEGRAPPRAMTRLDGSYERSTEIRVAETEAAMRRGDDVIFQATVFDGRWVGHPDFLLRVDGAPGQGLSRFEASTPASAGQGLSRFEASTPAQTGLGREWHYEVADTKLAHSAKASALIQICSYVEQIARIQGVTPENVHVVTGGAKIAEHRFRTAELMAYFRRAKQGFENELSRELDLGATYPDPVEHCSVCRWFYAECRRTWRADDALPLVAGISRRQRQLLKSNSITTMTALSKLQPPIELEGLKRSQQDSMLNMREQARLQVMTGTNDVPEYELLEPGRDSEGNLVADRGLSALPPPTDDDLFFDIEGDPFAFWAGLEYLFGVWDGAGYRGFWALNRTEEKKAFEDAMDLFHGEWQEHPEMHVYHYGVYEPSRLKQLAGRHATREAELDEMLTAHVFVDLFRVVKQAVLVGAERYSIKNLEPLYGFKRVIELRDANSSIVEFENLLEKGDPGGELKELIRGYNADDCVSTEKLRDWLEQQRTEAEQQLGVELPRASKGEPPTSAEFSARQAAVHALEGRLRAGVAPDPTGQSETDQARWLLSNLLDWHRRENKASWWRYYDLMTKSDDELYEEKEPIAHLTYVGVVDETKRSLIHRYRFPAGQEHSIDPGNELHDPQLAERESRTGTAEAVDEDEGLLDIKRPKAWAGQHPSSVVPLNIYRATAQQDALLRIGEWVADNGVESDATGWRAARDLLLRRPPRVAGDPDGGDLVSVGEAGSAAARRLAPQLDGTTLPIQGPPGSGKTYTGARMIVDLIREGQRTGRPCRIGIAANSHKAIGNLLKAVCAAATEAGTSIRGLQKDDGDGGCEHEFVEHVKDNGVVAHALATGAVDVVGGTAWLWARDEMSGLLDTLFVDEAGQMSLANVVAMSGSARNIVLLGDPQQLEQPLQGAHPEGAGRSALGHLLGDQKTVPGDRGLFLEKTYRMHPTITTFTSELFYEGKLEPVEGLEQQRVEGSDEWSGSGLRWVPVEHDGNTNASREEADKVVEIVRALVGREWVDKDGQRLLIGRGDIRVVSPFNAHRLLIDELLKDAGLAGVPVGTVDKFQGQEAPVSIYTMATSRPDDAPRGMDFLLSLNRLNVATSRARALAIVVASPALLAAVVKTPDQLRMANALSAFVEAAQPVPEV